MFNMVAVLSLRWLATSASNGWSAISLWLLAALFFFIPMGLAVADLSARFPEQGGIYAWTKRAFGEGHGFLCGWCYWVNNVLYPPSLLMATAVIATYVTGHENSGLMENRMYVFSATILMLWFAAGVNIVGLSTGKWLQNMGAIGMYIPGLILVALGGWAALHGSPATPFSWGSLVPDFSDFNQLNLWASVAFAFGGLELAPSMGGETADPTRNLPRSVYISAPLILFLYILGTASVLYLVPVQDVNVVSGFLQAIAAGAGDAVWLIPLAAGLFVVGNLGNVGAWLVGPARVALMIGLDKYFPPIFGRIHPKWKTPYAAILIHAVLATIFLILASLGRGSTVEKVYLILLSTMVLVYFIPFLYLFLAYILLRAGGLTLKRVAVGAAGFALTAFAMILAVIPPPGTTDPWVFEAKVVGGAAFFILFGGVFYFRGRKAAV
jgi:amino acid transporter